MASTLIYFDKSNPEASLGLLAAADEINKNGKTYALYVNLDCDKYRLEFDYVINVNDSRIEPFDINNITNIIEEINNVFDFDCMLFPATVFGRAIAPRAAMRLKTGLTADVTSIKSNNGVTRLVRPAFDGKILAGIVNKGTKPLMASIRPDVFQYTAPGVKKGEIITYKLKNFEESGITLIESIDKEVSDDIRDSKVLISGGGGTACYFDKLQTLADSLNGMVSASRRLVDDGIAPRRVQVGQSGKTVSPDLYIALGIYGSLQHVAGLKNVKNIIAVNINKNTPICSLADIVVEGDALEFIEKLNSRILKEISK